MQYERTYQTVAIHSGELFGMFCQGQYFTDSALSFGLQSAPLTFTSIADLLQWILKNTSYYNTPFLEYYLDDSITLGPLSTNACHHDVSSCIHTFAD